MHQAKNAVNIVLKTHLSIVAPAVYTCIIYILINHCHFKFPLGEICNIYYLRCFVPPKIIWQTWL